MKKLVLLALVTLISVGCEENAASKQSVLKQGPTKYDVSGVVTRGNFSFIPIYVLDFRFDPKGGSALVLGALEAFEMAHPELEIISWSIQKESCDGADVVLGVWVYHRKRQLPAEQQNSK